MTAMKDWLCDPAEHGGGAEILPEYLYRYMGSDGLAHTVASSQLRLNAWSQMNDPRESHRWSPKPDLIASGDLSAGEIASRVDKTLRGASKLLSLTSDRMPSSHAAESYLFHRGWARATLWAHYAAGHSGVCLVLNTSDLMSSIASLPARDRRYTVVGRVRYEDEPLVVDLNGPIADSAALDRAIEDLLDRQWAINRMHLTKNRDWSSECEVRVALVNALHDPSDVDVPLMVPVGTSLRAVIVGDAHPSPAVLAAGVRGVLAYSAPEMFAIRWNAGVPDLVDL